MEFLANHLRKGKTEIGAGCIQSRSTTADWDCWWCWSVDVELWEAPECNQHVFCRKVWMSIRVLPNLYPQPWQRSLKYQEYPPWQGSKCGWDWAPKISQNTKSRDAMWIWFGTGIHIGGVRVWFDRATALPEIFLTSTRFHKWKTKITKLTP